MKFRLNNRVYYGLHTKTWASIILLAEIILMIAIVGFSTKQKEAYAEAQGQYKQLMAVRYSYIQPTLDVNQEARAVRLIKEVWGKDYNTGYWLARCESGFREKVVNSIGAVGYFQIYTGAHPLSIADLQNGLANTSYAYKLFKEQGLNPWISSQSCWEGEI